MGKKVRGMTEVMSSRTFTLSTLKGHTIKFYKGISKNVPNIILEDCTAVGVMPVDDQDLPSAEASSVLPKASVGAERVAEIREVINALVERNSRDDFNASGMPNINIINNALGYNIDHGELSKIWGVIRKERAESRILSQDEMAHSGPVKPEDPEELAVAMAAAIDSVVEGGSDEDYTGAGVPTVRAIENRLGYDVTEDERDTAWAAHTAKLKGSAKTSKSKPKAAPADEATDPA